MFNGTSGTLAQIMGGGLMTFGGFAALTLAEGFSIAAAAVVIIGGVIAAAHAVIKAARVHTNFERDVSELQQSVGELKRRSDESRKDRADIQKRLQWLTRDSGLTDIQPTVDPDVTEEWPTGPGEATP
jgi:predicted lipid-binding transport protein (Tim44 family)